MELSIFGRDTLPLTQVNRPLAPPTDWNDDYTLLLHQIALFPSLFAPTYCLLPLTVSFFWPSAPYYLPPLGHRQFHAHCQPSFSAVSRTVFKLLAFSASFLHFDQFGQRISNQVISSFIVYCTNGILVKIQFSFFNLRCYD